MKALTLAASLVGVAMATGAPAATLSDGFAGIFADVTASPKPVDLVVPVPAGTTDASISLELGGAASGTPAGSDSDIDLGGLSSAILSIFTDSAPQAQADAEAFATRTPGSFSFGVVEAEASAALAFEAVVARKTSSLPPRLSFGEIPVNANILTSLVVANDGDKSNPDAEAEASAQVVLSDRFVSVGSRGTLTFDRARSEVFDLSLRTADLFEKGTETVDGRLDVFELLLPVDSLLWVGKRASVATVAALPNEFFVDGRFEARANATAIVDPIFSFDQDRFESIYGTECRDAGLVRCPDMTSLFEFNFSPGFGNGVAAIPLPPGLALILSAIACLGGLSRRVVQR